MQQQLLIDMFANFVILMILSKKNLLKDGIVKLDKLYKAFVQKEIENSGLGLVGGAIAPKLSNISVSVKDDDVTKKVVIKTSTKVAGKKEKIVVQESIKTEDENKPQDIISFIKSKINSKVNKIREHFDKNFQKDENKPKVEEKINHNMNKSDKTASVLEND
jgi:hypothetical protein